MKNWMLSAVVVTLAVPLLAGCGDRDRRSTQGATGVAPTSTQGIVGQLTDDPDDEVDPALQDLVARALVLGDTDEPLEF
jgi:hypothetical protein